MPERVESVTTEGVDYGWVMQVTFVVTILVGAPVVAGLSTAVELPSWGARVGFAVRVGAVVWFLTALFVYLYARRTDAGAGGADETRTDVGEGGEGEDGESESENDEDGESDGG